MSQDPELISSYTGITFWLIGRDPQQFNAYSYVANRPTVMVDPSGESVVSLNIPRLEDRPPDPGTEVIKVTGVRSGFVPIGAFALAPAIPYLYGLAKTALYAAAVAAGLDVGSRLLAEKLEEGDEQQSDEGAKSQEEFDEHQEGVENAEKELQALEAKLKSTKGPKKQRPIKEAIERLKREIKGHKKEMGQKWPNGRPE